jgi:hypothetical protein
MMALPSIIPSGVATAWQYATQTSAGAGIAPIIAANPGSINPPLIFEPPGALTNCRYEVWVIATGASPDWGGCQVWISADGTSYGVIGAVGRGGVQGVLTAPFPLGADPDTIDALTIDLTQSGGAINAGTRADADLGLTLAYVDGEFISYSVATLTSAHNYRLATYLRRGAYGSAIGSHAAGSAFGLAFGAFIHDFPANFVGHTIFFKFTSFNSAGGQPEDLSTVPAYPYTLTGKGACATNECPVDIVLSAGASEDWGHATDCESSTCDWGRATGPQTLCIDLGHAEPAIVPLPPPDDDTCDIQNVNSGTSI